MQTDKHRYTPADIPAQKLNYPASQADMIPQPQTDLSAYKPAGKLQGKVALITGGDSGIGRAVAIAYAMEGADVAIVYHSNDQDADTTCEAVGKQGRKCLKIQGDVRDYQSCEQAIQETVKHLGKLNILVNNAAYQMTQEKLENLSLDQFRMTMETNVYGYFYMVKAAINHLKEGDAIVNTGSIYGKMGKDTLIDYATSKGAVHTFTKALAANLSDRNIRVNAVVPGSVWTPAIPASLPVEEIDKFDTKAIMGRAGQPEELAPAYVFLACADSSFMTGALLEVTGGKLTHE